VEAATADPEEEIISLEGLTGLFVPVTVATGFEVALQPGATITDALQNKPGISGSTFAPGSNRPIIRGLDTYRVRVQENGIGSHDVSALSEDHAVPIDPYAVDRVEVIRGPATLRYGSQAIGGVVSVENGRIPTVIPQGGASAEIKGGASSVDEGWDGAFKTSAGAGFFAVTADGFKRETQDYETPRGREKNSFVDSEGRSAGASIIGRDGYIGVAFITNESVYGIPGDAALEGENPRIDLKQDKVLSKGELRIESGGIEAARFWFGATDYKHGEIVQEGGESVTASRFKNSEEEGRIEVQHMPLATAVGVVRGAIGVQASNRRQSGISFEGDSLLEPAKTQSLAGFIFEELQLTPKLRFQAAGRIESSEVTGIGIADKITGDTARFDRDFTPASGSLGFLYALPHGVTARLTGQHTGRAPDAGELFSKGVHEATGTFEIGNPGLEKEKAQTAELGFKKEGGAFRFDTSFYYTKFDGFIFKQITGFAGDGTGCDDEFATCGGGTELDRVDFIQRDATFYGAEIAAQYDIAALYSGVIGVDGQYDFTRAKFDDGANVPRIPPHRLGGGLYYRDGSLFLRAGILHAFEQSKIGENEIDTPGYTNVSAEISYRQKFDSPGLATEAVFGVKGDNLLDDEILNHASFKRRERDDQGVLEPGAAVRVFGTIKLN
jgi:iron complex outermembrane receptor protein